MKFKIFKFKSVTSTNDVALNLIQEEKETTGQSVITKADVVSGNPLYTENIKKKT